MYPLVRELADDGIPVTVTCRVLKISRQPYYRWLASPVTDAELEAAYVANAVFDAHRDDPEFGYRFLAEEVRQAGHEVCDRTVWRICRDNGWWSAFGKPKRRKGRAPGTPAHDDLVRRNFTAAAPNRLWLADIERHEALPNPAVMKGHRHALVAAGALKLRASLIPGTRGRAEAALTTTGRASTARWSGSGKRDGKAHVRNQRLNAPQESQRLEPGGSGPRSSAHPHDGQVEWGTPWLGDVAGREATVNGCGVAVAMLQGHSWAPIPSKGSRVNVGTALAAPFPASGLLVGGKARRRLMPPGWDGGPVVVRGRESRSHGEGVQRDRSVNADRGGRR
jgi:hypothetical protein